jgi:predicted phosphodiesterase
MRVALLTRLVDSVDSVTYTSGMAPRTLSHRVGVIGDVHAEDALLELALERLAELEITDILCTGDIADGSGSAQRCCDLLAENAVATVRGNHDRWIVEGTLRSLPEATAIEQLDAGAREFLEGLPPFREYATPSGSLLLCHGLGNNDMARLGPDDFGYALDANDDLQSLLRLANRRYIVNGHTHRRMVRKFGSLTVVNAGTLKREHEPCVLVIDFGRTIATYFDFVNGALSRSPAQTFTL